MKRLQMFVMGQEPNDDSYRSMYEGAMYIAVPDDVTVYESVYWRDEIAYDITASRKNDPTQPSVTVRIPYEALDQKGDDRLKRLKAYLLNLKPNDETYKPIYEGQMIATVIKQNGDPLEFPEEHRDPVYWEKDDGIRAGIGYEYTMTNKLEKDKPTVKIRIPTEKFGYVPVPDDTDMTVHNAFSAQAAAAADYCHRAFLKQVDELNRGIYNRSRPDKENGAYYFPRPGGEVMPRNAAYFAVCMPKYYENGSGISV